MRREGQAVLERNLLLAWCMGAAQTSNEQSTMMTSNALLELSWSVIAFGAATLGIVTGTALPLAAIASVAMALALFARSGMVATRWPRRRDDGTLTVNVGGALLALLLGALALAGSRPDVLVPVALLAVAGLVLDAPLEPALAGPRGAIAGGYMMLAGLAAILLLVVGFSARITATYTLVAWAAAIAASAHVVGAATLLVRSGERLAPEETV